MKTEARVLLLYNCDNYIVGIVYRKNSIEEIYFAHIDEVLPGRFIDNMKTKDEITFCMSCDSLFDNVACRHKMFPYASENLQILLGKCSDSHSVCEVIRNILFKR